MSPTEYKKFKGLDRENLRDHMTDLELIFSMLGEASTTEIERAQEPETFEEHIESSIKGGNVAKNARIELENEIETPIISGENYLITPEKIKKFRKNTLIKPNKKKISIEIKGEKE